MMIKRNLLKEMETGRLWAGSDEDFNAIRTGRFYDVILTCVLETRSGWSPNEKKRLSRTTIKRLFERAWKKCQEKGKF